MKPKSQSPIVVVDYGMGNLRSVSKALIHLGAQVRVSSAPSVISKAKKIVLPGVGAFGDAAKELQKKKLIELIKDHIAEGKKFLGICLGLQLLFKNSEESPRKAGLDLFKGSVKHFKSKRYKIPHMGWNTVKIQSRHPLLKGVPDNSYFYFVHSYYVQPKKAAVKVGECFYANRKFTAILGNKNVFATQFHPEKSQQAGLQILKNFIQWRTS